MKFYEGYAVADLSEAEIRNYLLYLVLHGATYFLLLHQVKQIVSNLRLA